MIEEVIRKANNGIVSTCLICEKVRLNEGYVDLKQMPITKIFIETFYDYSHGLCEPCTPEYLRRYGGKHD